MGTGRGTLLTAPSTSLAQATVTAQVRRILSDEVEAPAYWWTTTQIEAFELAFLRWVVNRRPELRLVDGTLVSEESITFATIAPPLWLVDPIAKYAAGMALKMENADTQNIAKGDALIKEAYASIQ